MTQPKKLEAKQVAILRHPKTSEIVGRLYLWETGEVDPMWLKEEVVTAIAEPLPGESDRWINWSLAGTPRPEE